jgi:hypothetical protein
MGTLCQATETMLVMEFSSSTLGLVLNESLKKIHRLVHAEI